MARANPDYTFQVMQHPRFEFAGTRFERARSGAMLGVIMGTAFSLYAFALYLVQGDAPFAKLDTTLGATVVRYYVAGLLAGPIVGIVWPLRSSRAGSGLVAGLGAFIVYTVAWMTQEGSPLKWSHNDWAGPLLLSVLVFLGGMAVYRAPPPPAPPPEPSRLRTTWPEEPDPDELA